MNAVGMGAQARSQPITAAIAAGSVLVASFALLYGSVIVRLIHDWATDGNYSHGFVIVPIAAYLAWERRAQLTAAERRPHAVGLVVVILGVAGVIAGTLGAELFIARTSMLAVLAGTIAFVWGPAHLRILAFPVAVLLLMIPIPAIVFNQIAFPLQLLASRAAQVVLSAAGIPVLREGNVIILANATLEVAEACSGIRSLVSLLTLGIVYGYFSDRRSSVRVAIALATVPVAVVVNGVRVAGTGIAAHFFGSAAAEGFYHTFAGWLVFVAAVVLLFAAHRAIVAVMPVLERTLAIAASPAWISGRWW